MHRETEPRDSERSSWSALRLANARIQICPTRWRLRHGIQIPENLRNLSNPSLHPNPLLSLPPHSSLNHLITTSFSPPRQSQHHHHHSRRRLLRHLRHSAAPSLRLLPFQLPSGFRWRHRLSIPSLLHSSPIPSLLNSCSRVPPLPPVLHPRQHRTELLLSGSYYPFNPSRSISFYGSRDASRAR